MMQIQAFALINNDRTLFKLPRLCVAANGWSENVIYIKISYAIGTSDTQFSMWSMAYNNISMSPRLNTKTIAFFFLQYVPDI